MATLSRTAAQSAKVLLTRAKPPQACRWTQVRLASQHHLGSISSLSPLQSSQLWATEKWRTDLSLQKSNRQLQGRTFSKTATLLRDHHFDTLKFVQKLKDEGFTEDQAVAMMKVLGDVIEERYVCASHI